MTESDSTWDRWPADATGAQARAYEEAILERLRGVLLPSPGPTIFLHSIGLEGERPDTAFVFRWTDHEHTGREFAGKILLWARKYPTSGRYPEDGPLIAVDSVVGTLIDDWLAGSLDPA